MTLNLVSLSRRIFGLSSVIVGASVVPFAKIFRRSKTPKCFLTGAYAKRAPLRSTAGHPSEGADLAEGIKVTATHKMDAPQQTLLRLMNTGRRAREQITVKMLRALLTLQERYLELRKRLRKDGRYEPLGCECKLDRLVLTARNLSWRLFKDLGYRDFTPERLWNQNYRFVRRLKGSGSIRSIYIEYEPNAAWLAPFRITIIPRDETGVRAQDLRSILELIPNLKIVLMEIAFDFPIGSVVDVAYIRKHLLSGKMWLPLGTDADPFHQRWGRGASSKADRVYAKWSTSKLRFELELHARFLRQHRIANIFDFLRLVEILIPHHVSFSQLDEGKLVERLQRNGVTSSEIRNVLQAVKEREDSLWEILRYLRRTVHLKNVRRLLVPVTEMNQVVEQGLRTWAAQWPTAPTRLGGKK